MSRFFRFSVFMCVAVIFQANQSQASLGDLIDGLFGVTRGPAQQLPLGQPNVQSNFNEIQQRAQGQLGFNHASQLIANAFTERGLIGGLASSGIGILKGFQNNHLFY